MNITVKHKYSFDLLIDTICKAFKSKKYKGQFELDGIIYQDGKEKQNIHLVGFNPTMFEKYIAGVSEKSDTSDWFFTGNVIFREDNFVPINRSKVGKGTKLLKRINEYSGENCYIPTDGMCFIKCVKFILKRDMVDEFNEFIYSFRKNDRPGIMTCARFGEFNKRFDTKFQYYTPRNRMLNPRSIKTDLDWVFYLHNNHFCLIKKDNKTAGMKEIEDKYEEIWKRCSTEDMITSEFNLGRTTSHLNDEVMYAWDCETFTEKDTNRSIPYACTLINLEKLRKMLERTNKLFPTEKNIPEEFYNRIMNYVHLFTGADCIDQMLQHLGKVNQKELVLISHNGSGFDNWIAMKNLKKLTRPPLKTNRGILRLPISNPFTEESLQKKWKGDQNIFSKNNYLQKINFTCSYQHVKSSLKNWGKSSELPENLQKIDLDIASYTQDNWKEKQDEWEPYSRRDAVCLAACLIKYNKVMKDFAEQSVLNNLTAPALSMKSWYHLYGKEQKVFSFMNPFIRHYVSRSVKGGRVSANRKYFKSDKLNDISKLLKEYLETTETNIIELFKQYNQCEKDKTDLHEKLKKIKCSKLMAFDANGLYASAMCDLKSEFPKAESARVIKESEKYEFAKLFNAQKFRPRCAILSVWFEYPRNMFFQPIPAKDKIKYTVGGKTETGDKIRFRNGFCNDVLTSVDIQEIVRSGGKILKILDGLVFEENFETPPFRDYILTLKEKRNEYKKKGDLVGSDCMKLLGNSLYGKTVQKDVKKEFHLWSEESLRTHFDSMIINYEKVNDHQYIVEREVEEPEVITPTKTTRLAPSHLGSFILAHSKRIMNNFIHVIDGFYKPEIYYTDTDSLYISNENWDKLFKADLTSENEYCKGKNDYNDGGIIFGLYLAPKIKYNIILTSKGELVEKKTFKGYTKGNNLSVEDYLKLASGENIENEFDKPWTKSFTDGVVIPKEKQKKVFKCNLNLVKRKPPNTDGIMYPYLSKDDINMDEDYEFDDFDYLMFDQADER